MLTLVDILPGLPPPVNQPTQGVKMEDCTMSEELNPTQQQTQDPGEPLLPLSPDADHPQHQESQGAHSRRQQEQ